jgi:hypothetical protein
MGSVTVKDWHMGMETPKFDKEKNRKMAQGHLEKIVADVAPGTGVREALEAEERMVRQIDETKEAAGRYIMINQKAEDMRTGRMKDALFSMQLIRERDEPPTQEEIKKITEDIRMAQFIRNDVDIEVYQGELKRFLKETSGSKK